VLRPVVTFTSFPLCAHSVASHARLTSHSALYRSRSLDDASDSDFMSTAGALGAKMTPLEAGKTKAAEADIVDFLREAGDALNSTPGAAQPATTAMPRRKTLKTRLSDSIYTSKPKLVPHDHGLPMQPISRPAEPSRYQPTVSGLSRTQSILDAAPNMPPPSADDTSPYQPYRRPLSPDRLLPHSMSPRRLMAPRGQGVRRARAVLGGHCLPSHCSPAVRDPSHATRTLGQTWAT
jgi:chitin synthase